ncbi:hypothetical protein IT571_07065, partial [Candidatus Sumerlaeota bacterium]|nr:hypothetical protein [Candidatus Sumerlaeota bacterium]
MTTGHHHAVGSFEAAREGVRALVGAVAPQKFFVAFLFLLTLAMLPVGRSGPNDGGGLL